MSAKAALNKVVFKPQDEKMLVAVQVKRRTKKKIPFLATGGQGDYMTFICVSDRPYSRVSTRALPPSVLEIQIVCA
ncbi:Syntaxin-binding protein 6 [Liparis tanakae]|uniref:Syntaxin-binding protein 6 n=1 Tax=Liparis tanakae TaxID=230148 RepID=A0A4Z2GM61_9TELE|nr:Syntaxin-binding protein 6 [Liparis tanakae]